VPFACSVYSSSDLQGWERAQAGAGGSALGEGENTAGEAPRGGVSGYGPGDPGGTGGAGGSTRGGAPALGGAGSGGNATPGDAGEGGAETPAGGSGAGGGGAGGGGAGGGGAGGSGAGSGGVPAVVGLVASYPCESANGALLADLSGNGRNASLANGSGGAPLGFSFSAGRVGNALTLRPAQLAYVSLPRGIVSQLDEVTIATWVKLKSSAPFQRIFDFGVDNGTFMYLVNAGSDGVVRFRITSAPLNKNQAVEGAAALPLDTWTHVAVTVGDNGVFIYVDGSQIAQQAPAALRPSDLGNTGNNFIGRSPFATDPYLDGQIDEFRIYERVLSPVEIEELVSDL
jgi:Concanavalin A-like lectin/glucanases superfamily